MDFLHVLNRGVDGRMIYSDKTDYLRFIRDLGHFNDSKAAYNTDLLFGGHVIRESRAGRPRAERDPIVDVHAWVLMKNHYHLLLSERVEGGITTFIRKLNVGYANYYNTQYERKGALFQGRTKKILIERDSHFNHIVNYIHLNPLDYFPAARAWRTQCIQNPKGALNFLKEYPWSSYRDYLGIVNFPDILTTEFFQDAFGDTYSNVLARYVKNLANSTFTGIAAE